MALPTFESETLNLGNIDPRLNAQFRDAIATIAEMFDDESDRYDSDRRRASISMKITFDRDMETRATSVETAMKVSMPPFKAVRNAVRQPHGALHMVVDVEADQLDLVRDATVHQLNNQE